MTTTRHQIVFANSKNLPMLADDSIDLVVTSPPYPMIQMWDSLFASFSKAIAGALENQNGDEAFSLMHQELDAVWKEMHRVLKNGGFLCINIGDAVRTLNDRFQLFPNHSRIIAACTEAGFHLLPVVLWRKQTNAPNKFMGSGMLPAGAYVTLEHEYILIFRKGDKRLFTSLSEKLARRESAFFWEERNIWFSDIWDFKGTSQILNHQKLRERSATFPFELPFRLIQMYSLKQDTVLDPFLGTGVTTLAAIASCRNSVGIELDGNFQQIILDRVRTAQPGLNQRISERVASHAQFVKTRNSSGKNLKYMNAPHGFPVITRQECELRIESIADILVESGNKIKVMYRQLPADNSPAAPVASPANPLKMTRQRSIFDHLEELHHDNHSDPSG